MTIDLINIGQSGARAARASIEITAQNIANASNPDYVRRSLQLEEFVSSAVIDYTTSDSLGGVAIGGIVRPNNQLIQARARDSASDVQRADTDIAALKDAELGLEQSGLFRGLVDFEASLTLLESDPTDPALRTGAVETARQLAVTFQSAQTGLSNARELAQDAVGVGTEQANGAATELARINRELVNVRPGTASQANLFDARDAALRDISEEFSLSVSFDERGAATVRLITTPAPAGEVGPVLVDGGAANTISSTIAADGTASFELDGLTFAPVSGAQAGRVSALADLRDRADTLDAIALSTITRANDAQANGAALDGTPGQPLFSGTNASDIALALTDGDQLALAPLGSPAGSRDTTNLSTLIAAIGADDGPIAEMDRTLLSLSSRIAGLETTREGLSIIAGSAAAELLTETGVDLDEEAANLIRLQQAFEANSRVIQVAGDIFDTILGLN
ncbi:flagellar hook-associated protein FlgK [Erythrobacter sp. SCSIO 43205]|uniref:flagellar hook-associated protein FlgK n=1 Tax=Erythrobacter sp. SCSIO 43205 TaxID=2779361 RepID=UPI001CA94766|nr:flagellar hook-associated protein FlgK [Erythrobacter sp. SCSIO 43205]UAB78730.1 flagellar hook-associated protein FlgK [Erythrobacter sp. SCSIO 43205]